MDLGRYKWYQSQTSDNVPTFSLFPEGGVDTRQCASKDVGPQGGVDLGAVPHRLEEGKSASEDAGPEGGVDCDVPHWLGRRTNHHL